MGQRSNHAAGFHHAGIPLIQRITERNWKNGGCERQGGVHIRKRELALYPELK